MIRRRRRERRRTSLRKMTDEDAARARAVVKGAPSVPDTDHPAGDLSDEDSAAGRHRVDGDDIDPTEVSG